MSPWLSMLSIDSRMVSSAAASRRSSCSVSSAMKFSTTTRGSCSTTWPSAMPSVKPVPLKLRGRLRSMSWPGLMRLSKSEVATISASIVAVVSIASISSSPKMRWSRFCTTSTPSVCPARSTGTPRKALKGSSPVSGR